MAPALVLCSSAQRTQETLERIAPALGEQVAVQIERDFYAASAEHLLDRLQALDEDVASVLLVGHNPAIERLALDLAGSGDQLAAVQRKYPTGALATLEFPGPWCELGPGTATLADFVTPKQLAKR